MNGDYDMVAMLLWFLLTITGLYVLVDIFGRDSWIAPAFGIVMMVGSIPIIIYISTTLEQQRTRSAGHDAL